MYNKDNKLSSNTQKRERIIQLMKKEMLPYTKEDEYNRLLKTLDERSDRRKREQQEIYIN